MRLFSGLFMHYLTQAGLAWALSDILKRQPRILDLIKQGLSFLNGLKNDLSL
jgi:hypothetical protein